MNATMTKGMYDKHFADVELADGTKMDLTLKPITGIMLKKVFTISNTFKNAGEDEDVTLKLLSDTDVLSDCLDIVTETIRKSYPEWSKENVDEFVSVNLFTLLGLVFQTNLRQKQ